MDLVDEKQRAFARDPPPLGAIKRFAQILHAGENRRELLELKIGLIREQAGNGRLAGARRAPKGS